MNLNYFFSAYKSDEPVAGFGKGLKSAFHFPTTCFFLVEIKRL